MLDLTSNIYCLDFGGGKNHNADTEILKGVSPLRVKGSYMNIANN